MNLIFFCSTVDPNNHIVSDTILRVEEFAHHPKIDHIDVIGIHGKAYQHSNKITVHTLNRAKGYKFQVLLRFFLVLLKVLNSKKIDVVYLYMAPTMTALFYPFKFLFGYKIANWFCHTQYSNWVKFSLRYLSDFWFNTNKSMARWTAPTLHLVGQGINPREFHPIEKEKRYDLVTVGRITPIKKIEDMLRTIDLCRTKYGKEYSLLICGDAFIESDIEYKNQMLQMTKDLKVEHLVYWVGSIPREELPEYLNSARAFLFTVPGGVGKASLEAMACGVPPIITNPDADDFFGEVLSQWILCKEDVQSIADCTYKLLEAGKEKELELREVMLKLLNEKYTLQKFIGRIVEIMHSRIA